MRGRVKFELADATEWNLGGGGAWFEAGRKLLLRSEGGRLVLHYRSWICLRDS